MNYLSIVLLFGVWVWNCEGSKILAIFPTPAYSHFFVSSKLVSGLAKKGHEVTVYTPFLEEKPVKNLKEIHFTTLVDVMTEVKKKLQTLETSGPFDMADFFMETGFLLAENTLKHEDIQKLLRSNEKYDLVLLPMFLAEGLMGIAHHFKAPAVLLATMPLFPWNYFYLGHPTPPSYVPNLFSSYHSHMNFWQRLRNSYYDLYINLLHQWTYLPKHREAVRKYIPGQPNLDNFLNNVSLVLANSHMAVYDALPLVPNAIDIGGIHIPEPKKLPDDLQKFLDESVNGVIVFSLGSNLKSSSLPQEKQNEILKAFSKLKENVLWKWETDTLPGQPKNVKLLKWLPQSDVMAHPNVKAAIIHGGLLSIMECIYHGKPFIGVPFFGDQRMNMATAEEYGYGIKLLLDNLNGEKLSSTLNELLNNSKYKTNIEKRSKIMRDSVMTPLDTAVYWIEYVIRHQGAPHLRYPGMDLTWYQRNLLDVIAFTFLVVVIVIFTSVFAIRRLIKRVCEPTTKKKQQ